MEEFFKQFRNNWHSRPAPEVDENDWIALQNRLGERAEKRRWLPLALCLALPLLLGSLGFNVFFFNALQQIRGRVSELETRRDTVVLTRLVYQTDTIFKTRILRERVVEYLPAKVEKSDVAGPTNEIKAQNAVPQFSKKDSSLSLGRPDLFPEKIGQAPIPTIPKTAFLPLAKIDFQGPFPEIPQAPASIKKQQKTLRHYLHDLRPTGISIAATGGLAYSFRSDIHTQGGWSAGISGAVDFAKTWRFWADVAQVRTTFLAKRMDSSIGVPPVTPPADNFVFKEADVPQGGWQFSLGFDRRFPGRRRLEPFVGLGWTAVKTLASEVSYDFVRQSDGVEWTIDRTFPSGPLRSGFGIVRAGFGLDISKQWQAELTVSHRFHFEKSAARMPGVSVLQMGFRRHF